jgi:hypothetical protein
MYTENVLNGLRIATVWERMIQSSSVSGAK